MCSTIRFLRRVGLFPFVAVLQSELADTGRDRMVAPLVPRTRMTGTVGRLTPVVQVAAVEHVLLVARMTAIAATDLRTVIDGLAAYRDDIVAALDYCRIRLIVTKRKLVVLFQSYMDTLLCKFYCIVSSTAGQEAAFGPQ
jgi:hypothetical protein